MGSTHMAREVSTRKAATPERGRMDGNQPADLDPINLGSSAGPAASSCATEMQSILSSVHSEAKHQALHVLASCGQAEPRRE